MLAGFELQLLAPLHQRNRFDCASASLNEFIRKYAKNQNKNDTTRVHVYADAEGRIAGFFTLSASALDLTGLPEFFQKGRSRLPVPATLLGRFAVDNAFAGRGVGRFLLSRALRAALESNSIVASAAVMLDLADDASSRAEALYRDVGFISLASNPRRMILPMVDIDRHLSS